MSAGGQRKAAEIRAEIVVAEARVSSLREELRECYSQVRREIVTLRKKGQKLEKIAELLGLPWSIVVNNLHRAGVRELRKPLASYPVDQQKIYRKCRRSGVSAERSRAEAGMESGAKPPQAHTPTAVPSDGPSGRDLL